MSCKTEKHCLHYRLYRYFMQLFQIPSLRDALTIAEKTGVLFT